MLIFRTTATEQLDGLAAETVADDWCPYSEFTFEAPNYQVALTFLEAWNLIEASTWSDSLMFLDWDCQVTSEPSEDGFLSWDDIQGDRSLREEMLLATPQSTAVA